MKSFQSIASSLIHGVQNTYTAYNRGYQPENPADGHNTAILEEDERNRRLTDTKEEQAKEALAAKTSVMFHESAIPHQTMAAVVEKERERRMNALDNETLHQDAPQHTTEAAVLSSLAESERERRILDNSEAQSREAIAAQVSIILKDAVDSGALSVAQSKDLNGPSLVELTEGERARRIVDVEESQSREALAAQTSVLIQNQGVANVEQDLSLTRKISSMIATEAEKQHVLDADSLMTPSLVSPRQLENQVHPGIETPLVLREDTPFETRLEEPAANEIAIRDYSPLRAHDEAHISIPSTVLEGLAMPVVQREVEVQPETFGTQEQAENFVQPEAEFLPQAQYESVPAKTVPQYQPELMIPAQQQYQPAVQSYDIDPRSIVVPAHFEDHAVTSSIQLYPMIIQHAEISTGQVALPAYVAPVTDSMRSIPQVPLVTQQGFEVQQESAPTPVVAAPAPAPQASSLAALQAHAMEVTDSAPFTDWVESVGQPSVMVQAPMAPVLVKSLSAKELKQVNRNINAHHNDALKEVRRAEKCVAKYEKYMAKGNTSKAERYHKEAMEHRSRVLQHEHIVVEEKAKIEATKLVAATPAL